MDDSRLIPVDSATVHRLHELKVRLLRVDDTDGALLVAQLIDLHLVAGSLPDPRERLAETELHLSRYQDLLRRAHDELERRTEEGLVHG